MVAVDVAPRPSTFKVVSPAMNKGGRGGEDGEEGERFAQKCTKRVNKQKMQFINYKPHVVYVRKQNVRNLTFDSQIACFRSAQATGIVMWEDAASAAVEREGGGGLSSPRT